ncbi:MAG: ABC transporter permease [Vicinamibacterales bacterium]
MSRLRRFASRIFLSLRTSRAESELSREISAHLQLLEDQFVAKGMSREDARYAAKRAFGGVEQAKELQRDERSFRWLAGWPMDLKLGMRMLVKTPGLTIVAVIALAVAIGGGAAHVEFVKDLFHPDLPIPGGDRVVGIQIWKPVAREAESRALADFATWRGRITTVEHFGAAAWLEAHLITGDGRTERARGRRMTASGFHLVATPPLIGRTLVEDDERPGAAPVAVIGQDLWQARFQSDPNIVGRTVHIGSVAHTIVGVMPAGFAFPSDTNLWTPLTMPAANLKRGEGPVIRMFGRLKEGTSSDQVEAELNALLAAADPTGSAQASAATAVSADIRPYVDSLFMTDPDNAAQRMVLYAANLLFLLLLALCGANVATLVFARTATRESEITVRTALGASRGRISAQLFAEALVLSVIAAAVGLAIAKRASGWVTQLIEQAEGEPRPFWWNDSLSAETILYALGLAVFAALIVGVTPALKATGKQLQGRLREAGAGGSTMTFGRLWTGIIIVQTAVTVICLALAASLGWTAYRGLHDYDVTFPREQILTAGLVLPESADKPRAYREIARRLKSEPGVVNVSYASQPPGAGFEQFELEFAEPAAAASAVLEDDVLWTRSARVGPNYFETVGIPLVAGRLFTESEIQDSRPVAVVDETFVRLILGGRNAVGLMVREPSEETDKPGPWHEIVGVVKDVTIMPRKKTDDAMLYRPGAIDTQPSVDLLVRTAGSAAPMSQRLTVAALSVDPDMRLMDAQSMDRLAEQDALAVRFFLKVFAVVAAVALLLSTAGIYALISFTLSRRTREIGIRVALGAEPRRIIRTVFSRAFIQIGIGVLAGALPAAVIVGRGVEDAGGIGTAAGAGVALGLCAFVLLVAMVSCIPPVRRALRIQPTDALRTT